MITIDILKKFCAKDRTDIGEPLSLGDFTYATNGSIAVRVQRVTGVDREAFVHIPSLPWDHAELTTWVPIENYPLPEKVLCPVCSGTKTDRRCPECSGSGMANLRGECGDYDVECPLCEGAEYPTECKECGDDGTAFKTNASRIPLRPWRMVVDGRYLDMIKRLLPGPHYVAVNEADKNPTCVRFKFAGGCGLFTAIQAEE